MLGVIGVNHVSARLETREQVATAITSIMASIPALQSRPHVIIQTCHRVECYFSSDDPCQDHVELISLLRHKIDTTSLHTLYSYFGVNCYIHLTRVVAGLDSAFFGETEIQGQVKKAYTTASLNHNLSQELHYLFQQSLRNGKVLRTKFSHNLAPLHQLEHFVVQVLQKHQMSPPFPLLLVGASATNQRICKAVQQTFGTSNLVIANRTKARAIDFAEKHGITSLPLEEALSRWADFRAVIFAVQTRGTHHLFTKSFVDHSCEALQLPLIIDLGVPRNVDPVLADLSFRIENMETLLPPDLSRAPLLSKDLDALAKTLAIESYRRHLKRRAEKMAISENDFLALHPLPV